MNEKYILGFSAGNLVLMLIAITAPVLSWWLATDYTGESHWFSRSGSIMVIAGVILENRLFIAKQLMFELTRSRDDGAAPRIGTAVKKMEAGLTHLMLIAGTLVWGYGDIVITRFVFNL